MRLAKHVLITALALLLAFTAFAKDMPIVDPSEIIAKYGKPDRIQSTEYDKPRPPMVTRMLEYRKEGVRFAFLADAPVGSPPPYKSWRLLGTQNPRDNKVLTAEEAERRMLPRLKKK